MISPRRVLEVRHITCVVATFAFMVPTGFATRLDSGVRGTVSIGPTCPVQREGQSCTRPYEADIFVLQQVGGKRVARVRSNADGRFVVRLPAGRYLLEPQRRGPFPRSASQSVTVRPHTFVSVVVAFDSGIR